MALVDILRGITKEPEKSGANDKYDSKTLTGSTDYMQEFSKVNPTTAEGLDTYRKLTGQPTEGVSTNKVVLRKKQISAELEERFDDYTSHHIHPIIGEIDEMLQAQIGYNFCPSEKTKSKKYEIPRTVISTSKEIIETIKKDPKAYIQKEIDEAEDFMKEIVGRYAEEVITIDTEDAQRKAFRAITEYKTPKFVEETYKLLVSAEIEIQKQMTKIEEKRKKLIKTMKPGLDSGEQAKYFAPIIEKEANLREAAGKLQSSKEIKDAIVGTAINTIKGKEENSSQ